MPRTSSKKFEDMDKDIQPAFIQNPEMYEITEIEWELPKQKKSIFDSVKCKKKVLPVERKNLCFNLSKYW